MYACMFFREYLNNIGLVDEGIQATVELLEEHFQHDGKTAYVLTSDHGMTNWGELYDILFAHNSAF